VILVAPLVLGGFAMFGAITFLPLYMQRVQGVSATESGLRLLPVMVGLLLTSLASGQIISRTGRYKLFPILGCGCFTVGCFCVPIVRVLVWCADDAVEATFA
jgi:cyanate permease